MTAASASRTSARADADIERLVIPDVAEGRSGEAQRVLAPALEFWRSVEATHFIREAEGPAARLDGAKQKPERTAPR